MRSAEFHDTRARLEHYFDRTAAKTWAQLTSDAPVSRVRATVRAGRDRMRAILLSRLPADLTGARVLDAGCGVGQASVELARRGAEVVAIDLSPNLLQVARARTPADALPRIDFRAGDMLDPALGRFDHVLAMDSLIHYARPDVVDALTALAARTDRSMVFTIAPRTGPLLAMHAAGKLFPRSDRSPAIRPVGARSVAGHLSARLPGWRFSTPEKVTSGFYISEALEAARS
jgi:magnesium-protoporphyrin O-methyltransferase